MSRTRNLAASNELADINNIIDSINSRTPAGIKIMTAFYDIFGVRITEARGRHGTSRGTHYDFEVKVDSEWKRIEHKGSQIFKSPKADDAPWAAGVQFHNGGCEKYSLAKKYARCWYDMYVGNGVLKEEFGLLAAIPTYEEWFAKDCRQQADPKTEFGKELKKKVREARGPKASLLEKRADVLAAIDFTDEDKSTFIREVLPIANSALDQKDYWLSIHGNLDGEFNATWYPKFMIRDIQEVSFKKNLDLEITIKCADDFEFKSLLRWGKGAGFSCLRIDLR